MDIPKKGPKIVMSGYYGFGNCGDEAVLLSIVHCIRKLCPDARITVLSGDPERTREQYGVQAVDRWSPANIVPELLTCRLLISGGGSLLQDVTSARSPGYYLGVIRLALLFRKKVMVYSQGVGPLTLEKNRAEAARVLNRCHSIALRDAASADLLRELGVTRDMRVTCDPVMALGREDALGAECIMRDMYKGADVGEGADASRNNAAGTTGTTGTTGTGGNIGAAACLLKEFGISDDPAPARKPLLFVAVRRWKDDSHIARIAAFLDARAAKGWRVLLVPAHFPGDAEANKRVCGMMAAQPHCIERPLTAREFLALAASADMVFSMRLHGLICAMAAGTPMVALSYDPKVDAFMEQAGMKGYCLPLDGFDVDSAERMIDGLCAMSPASLSEKEARRKEMQRSAWETAEMAVALLKS